MARNKTETNDIFKSLRKKENNSKKTEKTISELNETKEIMDSEAEDSIKELLPDKVYIGDNAKEIHYNNTECLKRKNLNNIDIRPENDSNIKQQALLEKYNTEKGKTVKEKKEIIDESASKQEVIYRRGKGRPAIYDEQIKHITINLPESVYEMAQIAKVAYNDNLTTYIRNLIINDFEEKGDNYKKYKPLR
ncbi:MAG: hypothetical protein K6B28_02985 [Lachnospiraceae bacterium]|nr:hypothetical protein [Lachnospiraceae bacterium]